MPKNSLFDEQLEAQKPAKTIPTDSDYMPNIYKTVIMISILTINVILSWFINLPIYFSIIHSLLFLVITILVLLKKNNIFVLILLPLQTLAVTIECMLINPTLVDVLFNPLAKKSTLVLFVSAQVVIFISLMSSSIYFTDFFKKYKIKKDKSFK